MKYVDLDSSPPTSGAQPERRGEPGGGGGGGGRPGALPHFGAGAQTAEPCPSARIHPGWDS